MRINNLEKFLEKIRRGEMPIGAVTTFADPAVTELTAEAGFDFVWIDGEHGEMRGVKGQNMCCGIMVACGRQGVII